MDDIKKVIGHNITDLRKKAGWTQVELAAKLNYSDKAISKWERAESVPDVAILKEIADLFGMTVDYLLEGTHQKSATIVTEETSKTKKRNRLIITLLSVCLVFLIDTILFVILGLLPTTLTRSLWMIFVYSLPAALVVLLVFNSIWGKRRVNFLIISLLVWSILLCVYLMFLSHNISLIFIIGIPAQIILILWANLKFKW